MNTSRFPAFVFLLAAALASGEACPSPKLLVDLDNGSVLYAEDADKAWYPASVTKLMTTDLALSAISAGMIRADMPIVMSTRAASVAPSKLGLAPGGALRLEEALRIMLTHSMNDVATSIAENLGGTEDRFVKAMNLEARAVGMHGTHFANASGLPDDTQVTTAEDLALLASRILSRFPERAYLFSIPELAVGDKVYGNTNGLVGTYEGARGMKTGYVCGSGFNLVAYAVRGDRHLLAVILGAPNARIREKAAANLLDYGFSLSGTGTAMLSSHAAAPGIATDLHGFACGRNWTGFSTELSPAARMPVVARTAHEPEPIGPSFEEILPEIEKAATPEKATARRF